MIRTAFLVAAILMSAYAVLFARPHSDGGPAMRDFEAYYAAGTAWRSGIDPYSARIWKLEKQLSGAASAQVQLLPFVGPPATLPVWSALSRLPFDAANIVWRTVLLVSAAALVLVALRLAGCALAPANCIAGAVFALGFGPLTSCVALGQIALPAFTCAALALIFSAAAVFAWAQPNVALALVSQVRTHKGALIFACSAAVFAFGCLAIAGPHGIAQYLSVLQAHGRAERFSVIQLTPASIVYGFGAPERAAFAASIVAVMAAIAAWAVLMRVGRDNTTRFCGTCALLPPAMPFFHEHDFVVAFIPAMFFALRCNANTWPFLAAGTLLCATDWLGLAQRPDGAVQSMLLAGAALLALFVLRRDLQPHALLAPAGVLVLIATAAVYAQTHASPVWPDAMRALPAGLHGDAASVWHAELSATGLFARNWFWALLRCGPFAGCAMIVYASMLSSRYPARSKNPSPVPA